MPSYGVPFSSQYVDLDHHEWRARGCGITALKMVMDYWHTRDAEYRTATLGEILEQGLRSGAYMSGIGWSHRGLVEIARCYGYDGFNVDVAEKSLTPKTTTVAWSMLMRELENGPVLVSVFAGLDPRRRGGHIIVLTGVSEELVFFNDPEEMTAREGQRSIEIGRFLSAFKHRYIAIHPRRT